MAARSGHGGGMAGAGGAKNRAPRASGRVYAEAPAGIGAGRVGQKKGGTTAGVNCRRPVGHHPANPEPAGPPGQMGFFRVLAGSGMVGAQAGPAAGQWPVGQWPVGGRQWAMGELRVLGKEPGGGAGKGHARRYPRIMLGATGEVTGRADCGVSTSRCGPRGTAPGYDR